MDMEDVCPKDDVFLCAASDSFLSVLLISRWFFGGIFVSAPVMLEMSVFSVVVEIVFDFVIAVAKDDSLFDLSII